MDRIPALSVHQPWGWLICSGEKKIENRSWTTPYRGPLLIHASKSLETINDIRLYQRSIAKQVEGIPDALVRGAIIGLAYLADCQLYDEKKHKSAYAGGPFCWLLQHSVAFRDPIEYKGNVGLFQVPLSLIVPALSQVPRRILNKMRLSR